MPERISPNCKLLALRAGILSALITCKVLATDADERTYFGDPTPTGSSQPAPSAVPVCQYLGQSNCYVVQPRLYRRHVDEDYERRLLPPPKEPPKPPAEPGYQHPPMGGPALGRGKN